MKKYALALLVFCSLLVCAQPSFLWTTTFGNKSTDQGRAIDIDKDGNIYTVGFFRDTVDFDPGPSTFNLTGYGDDDIFITKLDALGNLIWAKRFGGAAYGQATCQGYDIAVDKD